MIDEGVMTFLEWTKDRTYVELFAKLMGSIAKNGLRVVI